MWSIVEVIFFIIFSSPASHCLYIKNISNEEYNSLNKTNLQRGRTPFTVNLNDCLEKHSTFCTKMLNYPNLDYLDAILKRDFSHYMKKGAIMRTETVERMNWSPGEEDACKSRRNVMYPTTAENDMGQWHFIVNNQNFQQGIRVEECASSEPKDELGFILPNGYQANCKQFYIYRPMVALSIDGKPKTDLFKIPSCCKFVLTLEENRDIENYLEDEEDELDN